MRETGSNFAARPPAAPARSPGTSAQRPMVKSRSRRGPASLVVASITARRYRSGLALRAGVVVRERDDIARGLLQPGGRDVGRGRRRQRAPQDLALVRTGDDEQDLPRLEQRRQAARQRLARDVVLVAPVPGVAADARRRQRYEAGGRVALDRRLVEAEVAVRAEAEHGEFEASGRGDRGVVLA